MTKSIIVKSKDGYSQIKVNSNLSNSSLSDCLAANFNSYIGYVVLTDNVKLVTSEKYCQTVSLMSDQSWLECVYDWVDAISCCGETVENDNFFKQSFSDHVDGFLYDNADIGNPTLQYKGERFNGMSQLMGFIMAEKVSNQ